MPKVNGVNVTVFDFLNCFTTVYIDGQEYEPTSGDNLDRKDPYTQVGVLSCKRLFIKGEEVFGTGASEPIGIKATRLKNVNITGILAIGGKETIAPPQVLWDGSNPQTFAQGDNPFTGNFTQFANDVALARDTKDRCIVSNAELDDPQTNAGAAHIFRLDGNTWVLEETLRSTNQAVDDFYGAKVAMNGDGTRIAVTQDGNRPPNENTDIYTRTGTTWTLIQTIVTTYINQPTAQTSKMRMSGTGDILVLTSSSSDKDVEIYRWDGSAYQFDARINETINSNSYGAAIEVSQDDRYVMSTRASTGQILVWENTTGSTWVARTATSVNGAPTPRNGCGMNADGSLISHANLNELNTWQWNGSSYDKITNNASLPDARGARMSSNGGQIAGARNNDALCQMYEGDGSVAYTATGLLTPNDPEQFNISSDISFDGRLVLMGNPGWKISNGQQGRFFSFEV